jgi:hypothetical protein
MHGAHLALAAAGRLQNRCINGKDKAKTGHFGTSVTTGVHPGIYFLQRTCAKYTRYSTLNLKISSLVVKVS